MVEIRALVQRAASEWDKLWTSFIRAEVAQDEKRARELVAEMIEWHRVRDYPVPSFLEGYNHDH